MDVGSSAAEGETSRDERRHWNVVSPPFLLVVSDLFDPQGAVHPGAGRGGCSGERRGHRNQRDGLARREDRHAGPGDALVQFGWGP